MRRTITEKELEHDIKKLLELCPKDINYVLSMDATEIKKYYIGLKAHVAAKGYIQPDKIKFIDKSLIEFVEKHFYQEIK